MSAVITPSAHQAVSKDAALEVLRWRCEISNRGDDALLNLKRFRVDFGVDGSLKRRISNEYE
ncbi:MAG: hypothetical protein WAW46_03180 [Polaromonas sp.]